MKGVLWKHDGGGGSILRVEEKHHSGCDLWGWFEERETVYKVEVSVFHEEYSASLNYGGVE